LEYAQMLALYSAAYNRACFSLAPYAVLYIPGWRTTMQRRDFMLRSTAAFALGGLAFAGCTANRNTGAEQAAGAGDLRRSIDADVDSTIQRLYATVGGSPELVAKTHGVLVFRSVIQAGLISSAQYGKSSLRVAGNTVGYYSTTSVSYGFHAGAQSKARTFLFTTQEALDTFHNSGGWSGGVGVRGARQNGRERGDRNNHGHPAGRGNRADQRWPDGNFALQGTNVSRLNE
jgi:hypothetical protein